MRLTITQLHIDGVHRVVVIDRDRPRDADRIVYETESKDGPEALLEAIEFVKSANRSSPETTWV